RLGRRKDLHLDGLAPRAPAPMSRIEDAGAGRATFATATVDGKIPRGELIPVAADEHGATAVTIGALARAVVNVTGVDVTKPRLERDAPRRLERLRRCPRGVQHLPVRMKGGEVQGHVGAEPLHHPAALRFDLLHRIVLAGNEQSRDVELNVSLMLEIFQSIEHRTNLV